MNKLELRLLSVVGPDEYGHASKLLDQTTWYSFKDEIRPLDLLCIILDIVLDLIHNETYLLSFHSLSLLVVRCIAQGLIAIGHYS